MAYPGIALVAMVGVGLGLALWYLFTDTNELPHNSAPPPGRDIPRSNNSWDNIPSDARRRRPRSNSKAKDDCSICGDLMENCTVTVKCGHVFHSSCIRKWREAQAGGQESSVTCPLCRQQI